jgi:S-adenosylmethionine:tRNA ribosyltransferase-isomerase
MPTEWYSISSSVLTALDEAKKEGRRIVCVGTTSARTLESAARARPEPGQFVATKLFITPGFEFQYVDVLMTNFHQPGTTHLLLVAAFIDEANTGAIYEHALRGEYRFLSYGDAMLLEREEH